MTPEYTVLLTVYDHFKDPDGVSAIIVAGAGGALFEHPTNTVPSLPMAGSDLAWPFSAYIHTSEPDDDIFSKYDCRLPK